MGTFIVITLFLKISFSYICQGLGAHLPGNCNNNNNWKRKIKSTTNLEK